MRLLTARSLVRPQLEALLPVRTPCDNLAEWLRRLPAKQLCVARESSNLSNVVWLGGVMLASTVWDGRASVRFRAEPLGDIAQLVERCLSKAKAGGSTPLIPTVVGPDIKMAPHSIGFVGSVVEHLPCKQ